MSNKIGLYAGSFDPVTNGHLDLIKRASQLLDQLYVGIFYNQDKAGFLPLAKRQALLEEVVKDLPNVSVLTSHDQLTVDVAESLGATVLVRGLRNGQDLTYEASMDHFNHDLDPKLETIYLLAQPDLSYVSSSRIRELTYFGADIRPYVPEVVALELEKKYDGK